MALAGLFYCNSRRAFRMTRSRLPLLPMLVCTLLPLTAIGQDQALSVSTKPGGPARITLPNGKIITIPKERGQVGVAEGRTAPDGRTAGWLVQYSAGGVNYPISGMLVVWRAGKIIRRFPANQAFYSWAFNADGKQVAHHVGPLHGEAKSHCELRDIESGRLVAAWDGDLDADSNRPAWAKGLDH
jgi:hypothetical protein